MIKRFIVFALFIFSISCFSQTYKTIDTADYKERIAFLKTFNANNELLIKNLKSSYSGKTGSELAKIYKEIGADFEKQVKNKDFIFKSEFDPTIKSLIQRLRKNNPQIPTDLKILIAKDNTPNAYCLADGTFVINIGLFNWLDNDDQIASVISHELGHRIEQHSLKAFVNYITQDEKDKLTVNNLKSAKVNLNQRAFDVLKNRMYKKGIEKRGHEMQADSLGYTIFKNSDFKKEEFVNALLRLQDFDTISPKVLKLETYRKYFNLPKQEFKEKWLKKEDFSIYDYNHFKEKLNKDSLASHPEITLRIEKLKKRFPELIVAALPEKASESFASLEKIASMEILPDFYHSEDYGLGVYTSLQFLQDGVEEKYYKSWLGKCFAKIYEGRKNYNLNRYLDRVDPKNQSESYQQFLNFMWNLSLEDIKNIADYYQNKES
ncbi:M48 family metalloprotease [Chryseobacterium paludis]|uniref:M48 family metalloprotease n=1 Tax=Chryseobacterium paludis TaxID=2956784 RepID=UPI0021C17D07|nr:M48 family metalloprotease [Chryseobacterium paludis]